jgi:hypothetical protein
LAVTLCKGEGRHAGRDLHLHVDGPHLDAFERDRADPLDHAIPVLTARVAEFFPLQEHLGNTVCSDRVAGAIRRSEAALSKNPTPPSRNSHDLAKAKERGLGCHR